MLDELMQDKCGVFGIWGDQEASRKAYLGLHLLQHRGQEHCGIVTIPDERPITKHGAGFVNDIFKGGDLKRLQGFSSIGHVKYTTQGQSSMINAQPFVRHTNIGPIAVAHNGQFANQLNLTDVAKRSGSVFTTTSDSELVLHYFGVASGNSIDERLRNTFEMLKPAYSVVMLTQEELIGVRDPSGIRPLEIGRLPNGATALASESVAFDAIGAEHIGEVNPGEAIIVDRNGMRRTQLFEPQVILNCIFEHIYFGRPDSKQFGCDKVNSEIRMEFGRQLYREHPIEVDLVTPMPDSSNEAALGYQEESVKNNNPIPFRLGFVRSHYIGRTFIAPPESERDLLVVRKINPNRGVIEGKRILIVEDSVVRANTMKNTVERAREFGAKEVHLRVAAPPLRDICYFGINIPNQIDLAFNRFGSVEGIKDHIGVDSIGYISMEGMLGNKYLKGPHCTHCFDGVKKISIS